VTTGESQIRKGPFPATSQTVVNLADDESNRMNQLTQLILLDLFDSKRRQHGPTAQKRRRDLPVLLSKLPVTI